jgi:hypothetical protein
VRSCCISMKLLHLPVYPFTSNVLHKCSRLNTVAQTPSVCCTESTFISCSSGGTQVFAARNQLLYLAPQGELDAVEAKHLFDAQLLKYGSDASQFKAQFDKVGSDMHTHTHTCCRYAEYIHTHSAESTKDITHTHTHIHTHAPSPCIGTLCESEKCYCKLLYYALLSPVRACVQCHTHYCNALTPLSCCSIHGMIHSTLVTHTKVKNY